MPKNKNRASKTGKPVRGPLLVGLALCVSALAGCGGDAEPDPAAATATATATAPVSTVLDPVLDDAVETAAALDSADSYPEAMTGQWLEDHEVVLESDNAVTWFEKGGRSDQVGQSDAPGYRFCVVNTETLAWAEYASDGDEGKVTDLGETGGRIIGPECGS